MTRKLLKKSKRFRDNAGIALLTTILLLFLMSSLLVGFAVLLVSNQQLAGANNDQVVAFYAAEAGMEKMTADLGALFSITYSPNISQIDGLETTPYGPPTSSIFPGESVAYTTADGTPAYTITPAAVDANGNPAPTITTIKGGPYQGMTAMATEYTLNVNARTNSGREVNLIRTTQTVGIPMFQFGIFGNFDLDFFPGPPFNFGGRTHTNGNLWLAANSGPLTLSSKVDAWKDVIRQRLENGYQLNGGNYTGTVDVTTTGTTGTYRALGQAEGSLVMSIEPYDSPSCTTTWQTISQVDYNSNLINGKGSACPQYSTGANQLNLAVVTMGGGTTQSIDLIRRPVVGEAANVTNERYFSQASLRILLADTPQSIMNLPCVDQSTQPFDLSLLATPPGDTGTNWSSTSAPAALQQLAAKMILDGTPFIQLGTSGSATAAYSSAQPDGYWLPPTYYGAASAANYWTSGAYGTYGNPGYFPIIKGYIKIEAQLAPYPTTGCTASDQKDVTIEVLAWGYVGRNINPVSQSLNYSTLNPQWPVAIGTAACLTTSSCTQMDLLSNAGSGATHYYSTSLYNATTLPSYQNQMTITTASYSYPLPIPTTTALGYQNATTFTNGTTLYTGQAGSCPDPHPNALLRLERIRDNPSSLYAAHNTSIGTAPYPNYVASGTLNTTSNKPQEAPIAVVCGVDPVTGTLPIIADQNGKTAMWTPQAWDLWNNTLFDTREGTLRDEAMSSSNLPTLNGAMHYIELDAHNVARWFGGAIAGSGSSTKDPVVAPDNFLVYISDRRGNYDNSAPLASWPPNPYVGSLETGEFGWDDLVNSGTDKNGCPDNALETGEDPDQVSQLYTYGANAKYIHGLGLGLTAATALGYGQYGLFTGLNGTATTNGVTTASIPCTTIPTYSNTTNSDGIWPMMVPGYVNSVANANALRENPPLFFRRAVKIVNGSDLTPVGTCPGSVNCGLAIASENPVYVQGDYNANVGGAGWGSTEIASSIAADAVTLLSDYWNDANSFASPYALTLRAGNTTYYRTAIVAGATVPFTQPTFSGVSDDYGTDGGVHNFLRYIESWSGTLEYNGSIVDLYYSRQANGTFKCCNTVYSPPTRGYNFDTNFLNPTLLPPRTPLFRTVSTTGWTRVLAPQNGIYK
jgi:hypothetical protein